MFTSMFVSGNIYKEWKPLATNVFSVLEIDQEAS